MVIALSRRKIVDVWGYAAMRKERAIYASNISCFAVDGRREWEGICVFLPKSSALRIVYSMVRLVT